MKFAKNDDMIWISQPLMQQKLKSLKHNIYTMTNMENFNISIIVNGCLTVKFWRAENLFDVLMEGTNYCDDGFIAGLHNLSNLWISWANLYENKNINYEYDLRLDYFRRKYMLTEMKSLNPFSNEKPIAYWNRHFNGQSFAKWFLIIHY